MVADGIGFGRHSLGFYPNINIAPFFCFCFLFFDLFRNLHSLGFYVKIILIFTAT